MGDFRGKYIRCKDLGLGSKLLEGGLYRECCKCY